MSRPYLQHGRRHAPQGSDPIPGLGGTKWAAIGAASIVNVASSSTQIIDMNHTNIYTNAPSTFAIDTWTHSAVTYYGIRALEDGHYLAKAWLLIGGLNSASSGYTASSWANNPGYLAAYGTGGAIYNIPATSPQGNMNFYVEALSTVNGGSTDIWVHQVQNTSSVTLTAELEMIVIQLDADGTTVF